MRYKIALQKTDEGFAVWVPGLPGCWSQGTTEAEAIANIREAIADYVEVASQVPKDVELREIDVSA